MTLTYEQELEWRPWRDDTGPLACTFNIACNVYPPEHNLYVESMGYPGWSLRYGTRGGDLYIMNKIYQNKKAF